MKEEKDLVLIYENVKKMRDWMRANLSVLDWHLKMKDDLAYYMQLTARMDKRLDYFEQKLKEAGIIK